jgi:hypothetical protein
VNSGPVGKGRGRRGVDELAGGLRTAVNGLAQVLSRPAAIQGLTPTRMAALTILELHGPLRPGDLATRMASQPPACPD